jgi:hypothetical protein
LIFTSALGLNVLLASRHKHAALQKNNISLWLRTIRALDKIDPSPPKSHLF